MLVLDPDQKDQYFKRNWDANLYDDVMKDARNVVSTFL